MLKVDKIKCIGCGLCMSMCPESFIFDADGKSEVIKTTVTPCVKEAASSCPVDAISIK